MPLNILLALLAGSLCAASGTLMLKAGAIGRTEVVQFFNVYIFVGFALYGLGSGLWVYGLSKEPLSVVYPFSALSFVIVLAGAIVFQGERPSSVNLIGVAMVMAGIALVVWGRK